MDSYIKESNHQIAQNAAMKPRAESKSQGQNQKIDGQQLQIDVDDNMPMVNKKQPKGLILQEAIVINENDKDIGPKRVKKQPKANEPQISDVKIWLPKAGHRACTDDKTNKFRVSTVSALLETLDKENVIFFTKEEVDDCLLPQMDKLHRGFMKERMDELHLKNVDVS